jgi:hypothetical protein
MVHQKVLHKSFSMNDHVSRFQQEAQGLGAQLTGSRHRKKPDFEISYLWQYTDFKFKLH